MNRNLTIGRRLRRAIGVTTGSALIAGLSVVALAPGAVASDLDVSADSVEVSQETTETTEPAAEPAEAAPAETEVVETEPAATEESEDSAPVDEAPVAEQDEDRSDESADESEGTDESEATPTAPSDSVTGDEESTDEGTEESTEDSTEEESAAVCPGIDDDTDYRTLFEYTYYAADGRSLGSTTDWTRQLSVEWLNRPVPAPIDSMMVRAVVTLKDGVDISAGECSYDFSLASYEAQGSRFVTSGQQVFIDHTSGTITADNTSITLEVDPAECYGQSDLYKTDKVYNGALTPRGPSYSPISFDGNMVANWMGGLGCDTDPGDTEPVATFETSCLDDVVTVEVLLDNSAVTEETTFEVVSEVTGGVITTGDEAGSVSEDVLVPAGGTGSTSVTVLLDETVDIEVLVDGEVIASGTFDGEECSVVEPEPPLAAAYASCENDVLSIDVMLDNPGTEPVTFELVVDGEPASVEVEPGATETRVYEVSLGELLPLQVSLGDEVFVDEVFDADDCLEGGVLEPAAVVVGECVDEEYVVALALATADEDVTFEVVLDGESELVDVPADGVDVLELVLEEDETVTVEVLVDGEVLLEEETLTGEDCAPTDTGSTPPATETTPAAGPTTPGTQPRVLARTGAETWTVALVAAMLLAAGGALVLLGRTTPRGRRQA